MERIVYRKTLDVHKNGIQFTLQGFETVDKMSRKLEISLMASGDTIDLPLEQISAIMYVTTPNATEPSINECTIKDNKIICDVIPIVEEGITEVQLKLIETRPEGANGVLGTPKFAIEVSQSNTNDESAMQTTTYTALENAVAKAKAVYDARLLRIELDTDCMFRAYFADGTLYETDVLKELFLKGEALLSQSYARGGTGVREGEDTDNSMYYSKVSQNAMTECENIREENIELLEEVRKHGVYTAFSVDFETGEVEYITPSYKFNINKESGELETIGQAYSFEKTIQLIVNEWLISKNADIESTKNMAETSLQESLYASATSQEAKESATLSLYIAKGKNQAHVFETTNDLVEWLINPENAGKYQIGDNLYIVDKDVPDYWISEVLTEPDQLTRYYYKIAELETQKVDLTEINKKLDATKDYIIETSKKGVWLCEKWASGKAVCYCKEWSTSRDENDTTICNFNYILPYIFDGEPMIFSSGYQKGGSAYITYTYTNGEMLSCTMKCSVSVTANTPCWFNIMVIGIWKEENEV